MLRSFVVPIRSGLLAMTGQTGFSAACSSASVSGGAGPVPQARGRLGRGKPRSFSKLPSIRSATTCGFAACRAGRLCLPVGRVSKRSSSEQAGRLSLPACSEDDRGCDIGRKARGFPQIRAAEPSSALDGSPIWAAPGEAPALHGSFCS